MRNRRWVAGLGTALLLVLLLEAHPVSVDGTLVAALIEEPWSARTMLTDPTQWAKQARCRYQQRKSGRSVYTIACVCANVQRASSGAGFWSTMPGCLNP